MVYEYPFVPVCGVSVFLWGMEQTGCGLECSIIATRTATAQVPHIIAQLSEIALPLRVKDATDFPCGV